MEQFPSGAAQGQAQRPAILNPMDVVRDRLAIQIQKQNLARSQQEVLQSKQQTQNEAATHTTQVQAAADDAAARQALQATGGDPEKAASVLRAGGFHKIADTLDASRALSAKNDAETMTKVLTNAGTKLDMTRQILQGVDNEDKFQMALPALVPIIGPEGVAKLGTSYDPAKVKAAIDMGTTQAAFQKAKQDAIDHIHKLLDAGIPQRDEQGNLMLTPKAEKEWTEGAAKMFSTAQSPEDFAQDIAVLKHLQYPQEIIDKFGQWDKTFPDRVQSILAPPQGDFTLNPGDVRFSGSGRKIAEGLARPTPTTPVDQQELTAYLAKNPGKTAVDYAAWKASLAPQAGVVAAAAKQEGSSITPEALDMLATHFAKTGQLPALGMGAAAAGDRRRIFSRAAEMFPGIDTASNSADFAANKASEVALTKNRDAVVSFENTAGKNIDQFLTTAQKVIDSGSPWINKPLRVVSQQGLGQSDLSAFNAARHVAINEIAKVVSNPGLTGQLSDAARREVEAFIPADATLQQVVSVAKILKNDMKNRHDSMDEQLAEIQKRLKNSLTGQGKPGAGAPKSVDPLGIR